MKGLRLVFTATLMFASGARGASTEQVLYSFQGGTDGINPVGSVVFDQAGNLYGATNYGGGTNDNCTIGGTCGTVFQLTPQSGGWIESLLYVFQGKGNNDGEIPGGGLIFDGKGNLYGVTGYGGAGNCKLDGYPVGCGTVFELTPNGSTWTETILYSFQGDKDGYFPAGNLVFDAAGNLYGATNFGGGYGDCNPIYGYCGTIFKLSPPGGNGGGWTEKVLYRFKGGRDGAEPNGGLMLDKQGALYGTTEFGGGSSACTWQEDGCGTVFELKPPAKKGGPWTETILHHFTGPPDAQWPSAGLIFDSKGVLYGTTLSGGQGSYASGTAFQLRPPRRDGGAWGETILYTFTGEDDGGDPMGSLILDKEGSLYGTASDAGVGRGGTVFQLAPSGNSWILTVLYSFTGSSDGGDPEAGLIFDGAGNLYGTTRYGGTGQGCEYGGCGTVFEVTP